MPPIVTGVTLGVGGEGREVEPLAAFRAEFARAMSEAMLLPACVALFGVVAALLLVRLPRPQRISARGPTGVKLPPESPDPVI